MTELEKMQQLATQVCGRKIVGFDFGMDADDFVTLIWFWDRKQYT